MRFLLAQALGLALATTVVLGQAPKQVQVFAGVLDGSGAPASSLDPTDVHVMEDGIDATVTRVERLDWPLKLQLLVDNGVVKQLNVEKPGAFEVSNAETILKQL